MRRTGANTTLAFVIASLSLHGAAGVGLLASPARSAQSVIAERARPPAPIEMTLEPSAEPPSPPPQPEEADAGAVMQPRSEPRTPTPRERVQREEQERERQRERERERERFTVPAMVQVAPAPPPPPPPPPPPMHQQAVEQSQSNNQRADNAQYIAERDNNVAVETRAAVRGTQEDNPRPQHAATTQRAPGEGAGVEDVHDGQRDRQGAVARQEETHVGGRTNAQTTRTGAESNANAAVAGGRAGAVGAAGASGSANPAPESSTHVFASSEGVWGQYALRPTGAAARTAGANGSNGAQGSGGSGGTSAAARVGVAGQGAAGAVAALSPASTDYTRAFGSAAEQERRVAQERRTQARGESPTQSWQQLRQGMENYNSSVRVGNQTALRTRASPFATYLSQMHHRIHRLFADGFLASLDAGRSDNPLNDPRLMNTVEIVLEQDGRVSRIGIVRTSGNTMFDVAAMNSVRRSAPFGSAPEAIRSADGKVYIHWGFYRSERQCGTFNAEPFILSGPNAAGSRERTTIIAPSAGRDR